ncbi:MULTISPECIES: hypothetical protein [unclassified Streptomyces]|uniref:hypothetical protein n=1 Tax=unclassified Streptomyces TaxID=2593676 RepID=UPI00036AAE7F|nr:MULTISPECIES: hypothetical protein [unclassified Streptomyces]MYQ81452.1 hypothetical protein [Streptomyces sp. SID4923]
MTALTGVIQQRRTWLRLLVLVGVPILLTMLFSHHAWADNCSPKDEVPNLFCEPPKPKDNGKVLGIFDVVDKNGVPISAYGLNVDQGGMLDVISKIIAFLIGVGFSVLRTVIGFACWLVDWALDFGLAKQLLNPVSDVAATIKAQVIDSLGLKILFLTLVAVYAGYLILFKQRSKGWIEICTSLVIASIATVTLASPGTFLIGNADDTGVLGKTKQFSLDIADVILEDRCAADGVTPAEKDGQATTCDGQGKGKSKSDSVARPITDGLVDAFIQRPVWVLYTKKPIDGACSAAYGKATLARYNFNRLVLPRLIEEENNKGWMEKLGDAFSDVFSLDGLKDSLLIATGNPWAIYTVVKGEQKEAVEEFKKKAEGTEAWKTYISGKNGSDQAADPKVQKACGGDVPMDDQQISASLDNLLSVWFIALAAIIVVVLVVAVSCTFLISQVWMAIEVIRAQPALVAGILPGGGRTAMWNWVSGVVRVILAIFLSVMFLAFFLVMVIALLNADTGEVMTVKFLTIDFLAVAFLIFRKKITAAAKNISSNFGQRMASKTGNGVDPDDAPPNAFQGATENGKSGLEQLKDDGATLSKVGGRARDLWKGKAPGGGGGSGGGGGGGGGGAGSGKTKKSLKDRVQGAVKLGTTVAAAVGSGGTSAAVQATAKAALKARLKKAATNRLQKNRVGRATLTAARTGRYLKNDAPITRSRFRNAAAAERRNLADSVPPTDGERARDSQRDAARRMRQTRSRQRSGSQQVNGTVNSRRNAQRNARRSSGRNGRRTPRGGGSGG